MSIKLCWLATCDDCGRTFEPKHVNVQATSDDPSGWRLVDDCLLAGAELGEALSSDGWKAIHRDWITCPACRA